ncbi:Protein BASIC PENTACYSTEINE1 [Glycine max]|nr:Protein BASIC PENTACYSTEINE1 [Glycine max]
MRDAWISQRDKYMNMIPTNHNYGGIPETSSAHQIQMIPPLELPKEERPVEEAPVVEKSNGGTRKKRQGPKVPKSPKAKKPKRGPRAPKDENAPSVQRARVPKKTTEIVINGIDMDISSIPIPVCSCTGAPQQCYKWGSGGWQSACCTTGMSVYPLPMSTKRRGARIAGRKMSIGAFKKVLEKLAAEGYNFSNPIDLRTYWAKHGTNKFVTISMQLKDESFCYWKGVVFTWMLAGAECVVKCRLRKRKEKSVSPSLHSNFFSSLYRDEPPASSSSRAFSASPLLIFPLDPFAFEENAVDLDNL